jgi:hypothetical protein
VSGPKWDDPTKMRILAGMRALAEGNDSAPHAELARDLLAGEDAKDIRAIAEGRARQIASSLGLDMKALNAQRDDIRKRFGVTQSKGIRWEGNDRVLDTNMTREQAIEHLEKLARAGSVEASNYLRAIRLRGGR